MFILLFPIIFLFLIRNCGNFILLFYYFNIASSLATVPVYRASYI